jgi:hypothetical protein
MRRVTIPSPSIQHPTLRNLAREEVHVKGDRVRLCLFYVNVCLCCVDGTAEMDVEERGIGACGGRVPGVHGQGPLGS